MDHLLRVTVESTVRPVRPAGRVAQALGRIGRHRRPEDWITGRNYIDLC